MIRQVLANFAQKSQPFFEVDDDDHLAGTISNILIRLEEERLIQPMH